MQRSKSYRQNGGFTLIELLVVIAIIAILAAILFPVFAQARAKARQASCQSNLKQLGLSMLMYVQDYDERYPFGGWRTDATGTKGGNYGTWEWQNTIQPYVKSKGVFQCPETTDLDEDPTNPQATAWNLNPVNYLYNNQLSPGYDDASGRHRTPAKLAKLNEPATNWMLMDGHSDWGGVDGVDYKGRPNTPWLLEDTTFGCNASLVDGWLSWQGFTWGLPRHNGGGQVVHSDGHVKYYNFSPTHDKPIPLAQGNTAYETNTWFESNYPCNKVMIPGQDNTGAKWGN